MAGGSVRARVGDIVALCDGTDRLESKALGKNSSDRNGNGIFFRPASGCTTGTMASTIGKVIFSGLNQLKR